ncbi:hypothetical protein OHA79_04590 [Streptomyces sp. NBC_00841]|uniref:hypothetical protein n=1 Tax=Streptomyces sp. NBC_00841 TaxID=2975847 RepID=UPI002DDA8E17|nr:hypothetical protein [Streptomyces sp. NBC_00841]WRZ97237.1 hypothetical protein OHA79_04590 [Streptomyces sp. NBC_00841]
MQVKRVGVGNRIGPAAGQEGVTAQFRRGGMEPASKRGAEGVRMRLVRVPRVVPKVVEVGHVIDIDHHRVGRGHMTADRFHRLVEVRLFLVCFDSLPDSAGQEDDSGDADLLCLLLGDQAEPGLRDWGCEALLRLYSAPDCPPAPPHATDRPAPSPAGRNALWVPCGWVGPLCFPAPPHGVPVAPYVRG